MSTTRPLAAPIRAARAGGTTALSWAVRIDGPLPGALNMARDHALTVGLPAGGAVLRLYRWERPTLSFGRNEPARACYDATAARRLGVDVVRRPTGGRAVLHWRELTYAVVAPVRALGGPRAAYGWINARLARGLASLGVPAEIAPEPARTSPLDAGPCFRDIAGGEVTATGRKLVGSAQARLADNLLQHGSILIDDDQALLEELAAGGSRERDRPATLRELLGRPLGDGELERALLGAFHEAAARWEGQVPTTYTEAELEQRYRSEAWTWRR